MMPDQDADRLRHLKTITDLCARFDGDSDLGELEHAAAALRRLDPKHPLLPALELRMRQTVRVRLIIERAKRTA